MQNEPYCSVAKVTFPRTHKYCHFCINAEHVVEGMTCLIHVASRSTRAHRRELDRRRVSNMQRKITYIARIISIISAIDSSVSMERCLSGHQFESMF